jgi:pimeloyl-ACP methyl ester carboxylesterase
VRIRTPHFDLAAYAAGEAYAPRLALCLPGYCDTKDYPDMRTHADLMAGRGYYALAIDPPGTWESGGDIGDYTTTSYLQAVDELIHYFGDRPTVLVGKSMGGRMAQLSAQNAAVVAFISVVGSATGAVADNITEAEWPTHSRHTPHRDLPGNPTHFKDFVIPYSFVKDAERHDAFSVIGGLRMPKLYIAGADDTLVTPAKLRRAYEAAGEPKEFVVLLMGHDYRKDPAQLQLVNDTIARFLDDHHL